MRLIELNTIVQTLGWVLLHSVWQGLLVYLLFLLIRKMIGPSTSSLRYVAGVGSLALVVVSSIATFIYLSQQQVSVNGGRDELLNLRFMTPAPLSSALASATLLISVTSWINRHLQDIVTFWMVGIFLFGCRLFLAGWYTARLQRNVDPIEGFWKSRLGELSRQMGIKKIVVLSQSQSVDSPILLGYLKPVILLPVGILSGLSTDQVEAILLHELAHVRRSDYAINFAQSILEVVFFFNPFVWAISDAVRIEREQCCDDAVIQFINPLAYVQALYKLEATRMPGTSLALAANGKQNQLLQRIKRIMEPKEIKKESSAKTIPALVVITLIMISGLFIRAYLPDRETDLVTPDGKGSLFPLTDTTKKDVKRKSARHSIEPIHTEESIEEGVLAPESPDETDAVMPVLALPPDFEASVSEMAAMAELAPMAEAAELAEMARAQLAEVNFNLDALDTLPELREVQNVDRNWDQFEKEFTTKFREKFADFYQKNQPEFEKMMKDLEANMERLSADRNRQWSREVERKSNLEMQRAQRALERIRPRQEEWARNQERAARKMERDMSQQNLKLAMKMDKLADRHRSVETRMKHFETELTNELVQDGYLTKDDKIKNIDWKGDDITVNGKKIKDKDKEKYKALHQKYFEERGRTRHEE